MKFLTNTHDPKDKNAKMYVARRVHETQEEAWRHHLDWLKDKVIGEPQATEHYTVGELKEMGLVGVYAINHVTSAESVKAQAYMETKRVDEYHKHGCHFYGKLVVVDYMEDVKKDPKWGTFNAGVTFDYLEKAQALVQEKYGENVKVLLSIPELVVRLENVEGEGVSKP